MEKQYGAEEKGTLKCNTGKLRSMSSIYLTCGNQMLLLFRQGGRVVNNVWVGSAGGHFEEYELGDARACVLRELQEELAITEDMLMNLNLRYVTLRYTKGEIRQNYYFFAELKDGDKLELRSDEGTVKWFPMEEVNNLEMPFSAQFMVAHYLETGRKTDCLYSGVADGEKVVFIEMPEF